MGISMSRDRQDDYGGRTLPLLALLMLLKYGPAGASRPPVTAALIAANALVYFRPGALDAHLPRLRHVMFNPYLIIKLETSIGSSEFASMVVSLLGLSQGFTLLLSKGLLLLGNHGPYYQFSAGFSGVVLGMNVVLNARSGDAVCLGVVVPAKYVAWLELLIVQVFNPEAQLVGNVGGILAGLAYLWLKRGPEPLALMFSGIADIVSRPLQFARRLLRSPAHHRRSSVQGHVASVPRETGHGMWRCTTCYSDNSRCTDVCETCSTPHPVHAFSRRQHLQDGGNSELSVEEIRRRRLQRFEK